MQVDLEIVVYAVIAALLLGRLWSILGTRSDEDVQRPNPFTPRLETQSTAKEEKENVPQRMQPPAPPPQSLAGGLIQVKNAAPSFDEKLFLQEARDIFTSVVKAYASGNLSLVSDFLSPKLLDSFEGAVNARISAGQTAETKLLRIKEAEVTAARAEDKRAFVTVKFVSNQENLLRDSKGEIGGGEGGKAEEVFDLWTFFKDGDEPGSKWTIIETRS